MAANTVHQAVEGQDRSPDQESVTHNNHTTLAASNQRYLEAILNNTNMPVFLKDDNYRYIFINRQFECLAEVKLDQIKGRDDFAIFPEPVAQLFRSQDKAVVSRRELIEFEETISLSDGVHTFITAKFPLFDTEGRVGAVGGICTDITARKDAEEALIRAQQELEQRVAARTAQLDRKTEKLKETNIALKILLDQREDDKKELEKNVMFKVEKLIAPYLEKIQMLQDKASRESLISVIQANLANITASFAEDHKNYLSNLTPAQIQIADLIKHGHTTKEIATLLHLSPSTIACHRQEIRKRLRLTNKKINLQAALTSNS